jgi:ribosomal protein L11 methyltransferase
VNSRPPGDFSSPAIEISWTGGGRDAAGSADLAQLIYAALDDFEPLAVDPQPAAPGRAASEVWRVFFRSSAQRDAAADALRRVFAVRLTGISSIDVPDEGWARRSQENLRAVRVGRVIVAPPWDQPEAAAAGDVIIVIDPSTGFGTGHHETTRLCLGLLQRLDVSGQTVIDIGTGSGVLAIAAAKLGAARVIAMDNDPDALRNARENVSRNGCDDRVHVLEAELGSLAGPAADVVMANLTAAVLEHHASVLNGLLNAGGSLVISGFGRDEAPLLAASFAPLSPAGIVHDGNWSAQLFHATLQ